MPAGTLGGHVVWLDASHHRRNSGPPVPQAGGTRMAASLSQCTALPLAAQLWRSADAQLQRSLMTAVSAVASAGAWQSTFCFSIRHVTCTMMVLEGIVCR